MGRDLARLFVGIALGVGFVSGQLDISIAQDAARATVKPLMKNEAVSGISDKEAHLLDITWPAGSGTGRHTHSGDEYAELLEGELELNIDGQPPRIVKAGESYHNAAGVVHETKNVSGKSARSVTVFIVEKGKPISEPVK